MLPNGIYIHLMIKRKCKKMKKFKLFCLIFFGLCLSFAAFSACSDGGDSGNISKPDSPMNSESYRESNISGDDKESERVSESESESGEESVHTHKFERNADERYLKSAATCEKRAEYYFSCECGEKSEETFEYGELSPHTVVIDEGIEATCTKSGRSEGKHCSVCNKILEEQQVIPALGHDIISHDGKAATCTEAGYEAYEACSRCDYTTYTAIPALGHDYVPHDGKAATCTEAGYKTYMSCTRCDYTTYEVIPALGHNYVDGKCARCGAVLYSKKGNYVYFGSYPQTKVSDKTLLNTLNAKAGELPTEENSYLWNSYGYYINGSVKDYMWYIDEEVDGSKYRGVYFTSYRPRHCVQGSDKDYSSQKRNGYFESTAYWFKYEVVRWRVLTEIGNRAFLMCNIAIDAQQYYNEYNTTRLIDGKTVYVNNYAESHIRKWLNETFYNTAFNDLQKAIIGMTSVDNSARSANPFNNATQWNKGENEYACENTLDKIFLLSEYEVTNPTYGFTGSALMSSDYAKSQGCYQDNDYNGSCRWWLRSPYYDNYNYARCVDYDGHSNSIEAVSYTSNGIVPAMWITL